MLKKSLLEQPLRWALGLALAAAGLALAAVYLWDGPDLELKLHWDRQQWRLELEPGRVLVAPREGQGPAILGLRFWERPERISNSRQAFLSDEGVQPLEGRWRGQGGRWRAAGGGLLRVGELGPQGSLTLRFLDVEDLNIFLGAEGFRDSTVFMLRPDSNDLGWYRMQGGHASALNDHQPLAPLGRLAWRWALAEALAWAAAAAAFFLLAWGLALLLGTAAGPRFSPSTRGLPLAIFGLALLASAWSLRWGGDGLPHVSDEISALFQSKILAVQRLSAPAPPIAEAFRMDHVRVDPPGWRGKYPLLWPLLLAPFTRAGFAWLCAPFYGAVAVLLLFAFARAAAGRAEALAAAGLLACSPQFLWLAGSFFNHAASLAAALLLLYGAWSALERQRPGAWGLAAIGAAALAVMRPYTAALICVALALWALWPRKARGAALRGLALVAAVQLVALGVSNTVSTGSPWTSPYLAYEALDRPGFGPGMGSLPSWGSHGHDAVKGLANTALYLSDLRQRALGWPWSLGGGLLLLALLLRKGWQRLDSLLALSALALIVGHYFYWCGHLLTFGTFYWYEAIACLVWLALRGAGRLAALLVEWGAPRARQALALLLAVFSASALLWVLPQQAASLDGYAGADKRLALALAPLGPAMRGLVLVQDRKNMDYHAAFALQEPFQDGRFVLARSRGAEADRRLAAMYPSRRALVWDGKLLKPFDRAK